MDDDLDRPPPPGPATPVDPIRLALAAALQGLVDDRLEFDQRRKALHAGNYDALNVLRREFARAALKRLLALVCTPPVIDWYPDMMRLGGHVHLKDI
jgi:hypothetical protein